MARLGEIALIEEYFAPLAAGAAGSFGLKDDAAFLACPRVGLVVTADALVAGVHFFEEDDPEDVAYKALAVNISDLAAKGARPLAYLMTLALAEAPARDWASRFASGLEQAQQRFGIGLLGGDTVAAHGAWWISITALGEAPPCGLVPRGGAKPGDRLYVTGSLGDAALGLKLRLGQLNLALSAEERGFLLRRYLWPEPRLSIGPALAACANAAMDISDGLVLDLSRLCTASGVSAEVEIPKIPLSAAAAHVLASAPHALETVLTGGDDYELLAAVPPENAGRFEEMCAEARTPAAAIGTIVADGAPPRFLDGDGKTAHPSRPGFEHFA